jgi:putative methionine-R-sulfoxide reductase with GAF domain
MAEVEKLLTARPRISSPASALDETADALFHARHYSWIGIYLKAGERMSRQAMRGPGPSRPDLLRNQDSPRAHSTIVIPIHAGQRTLGVLEAASDREYAFGREERRLLTQVAARLGRYLATTGKPILRRLREESPAVEPDADVESQAQTVAVKKSVKPLRSVSKPFGRTSLRPASGVTS